jgi:hypothetical protein
MSPLQNVYGDLALDSSVVAGNAILTIIAAAVADLDANTDTIEALLTTIDAAIAAGNVDLAAIAASVADLDSNTDTIEALLLAGNLDLAAIAAAVADIDLNTDTIESLLTTIDGRVDGLEALSTAANALLTGIDEALNPTATDPAGLSAYRNISLLNVGQSIKGSAAKLYTITMINNQAGDRFVKLYNVAGVPTAADTPVFTFGLSATDGFQMVTFEGGVAFPLGLGIRATTGVADADNTAPGANQVIVNVGFR